MIVTCEKCGKEHQIDPEQIKEETTTFQCDACNYLVTVSNRENNPRNPSLFNPGNPGNPDKPDEPKFINLEEVGEVTSLSAPKTKGEEPPVSGPPKRGIGLRGKMFFLFFFVPICLIVAASLYYLNHMKTLSTLITKESYELATKMAEQAVAEKGRAVAREVKLYLETHPNLKREDFIKDPKLKEIAIQKIGKTGYTLIVSRENEQGQSFMWVHPKAELVGIDIIAAMKKRLGPDYERWYKVQGKEYEVCGYYKWIDGQEKYTCGIPIAGTTDLNIAGAVYLGEFTQPMEQLETKANAMTEQATRAVMIILAATAVLIAIFVSVYSYRLSGKLKYLANAADRISTGDLDTEIEGTKSRDELGHLTSALGRMQTSIRLALKRLRERR